MTNDGLIHFGSLDAWNEETRWLMFPCGKVVRFCDNDENYSHGDDCSCGGRCEDTGITPPTDFVHLWSKVTCQDCIDSKARTDAIDAARRKPVGVTR